MSIVFRDSIFEKVCDSIGSKLHNLLDEHNEKLAEEKAAEKYETKKSKYINLLPEICETVDALTKAKGFDYLKSPDFQGLALPFDGTYYDYCLHSFNTDDDGDCKDQLSAIVATINAIAQDRYYQGHSSFFQPLYFSAEKDRNGNGIIIRANDSTSRFQADPEPYNYIGQFVGRFTYVYDYQASFFVASRRKQYLQLGTKFQIVDCLDGIEFWQKTKLIYDGSDGNYYLEGFRDLSKCGEWARIP